MLPSHSLVLSYYVVHFPSRQVDEVLPSSVDRSTQQWLATQLKALYTLSERAALDAAAIPHHQSHSRPVRSPQGPHCAALALPSIVHL